jgi:hypothetical protein
MKTIDEENVLVEETVVEAPAATPVAKTRGETKKAVNMLYVGKEYKGLTRDGKAKRYCFNFKQSENSQWSTRFWGGSYTKGFEALVDDAAGTMFDVFYQEVPNPKGDKPIKSALWVGPSKERIEKFNLQPPKVQDQPVIQAPKVDVQAFLKEYLAAFSPDAIISEMEHETAKKHFLLHYFLEAYEKEFRTVGAEYSKNVK